MMIGFTYKPPHPVSDCLRLLTILLVAFIAFGGLVAWI
jgi:hypothetical protein